jgi:hypothetical protein
MLLINVADKLDVCAANLDLCVLLAIHSLKWVM